MKGQKQRFDLIEVLWDDAAAQEARWLSDIDEPTPHFVHSVGFCVFLNKNYVVIAQDCALDGDSNGRTQIPRGMVKSMKVLRKKD